AAVKTAVRFAHHHGALSKARVLLEVRYHKHFGPTDCGRAYGRCAWGFGCCRGQSVFGFEPATIIIDEDDIGDGSAATLCRQFGDFVIGDLRRSIEDATRT